MTVENNIIKSKIPIRFDEEALEIALDKALEGLDPSQQYHFMLEIMAEYGRKRLAEIGLLDN